jgi:beta-1,4-mannosyltransferase
VTVGSVGNCNAFSLRFLRLFKGRRFVIDWHNLRYSIWKVSGPAPFWVRIAERQEFGFGGLATSHITVTEALKALLASKGINATIVYDRPLVVFKQTKNTADERVHFERFLEIDPEDVWLVSSSSWTPDEDIGILLTAADELNDQLGELKKNDIDEYGEVPSLSIIITGKGSDQDWFEAELKSRQFEKISFALTYFDDYDEYARFLGCCDIGVSLHVSSSGVDLPMKGLDMIGSGLPVLSVNYACIGELVKDGTNGILFNDGVESAEVLRRTLVTKEISIDTLQNGSAVASELRWDDEWCTAAQRVLFPVK